MGKVHPTNLNQADKRGGCKFFFPCWFSAAWQEGLVLSCFHVVVEQPSNLNQADERAPEKGARTFSVSHVGSLLLGRRGSTVLVFMFLLKTRQT